MSTPRLFLAATLMLPALAGAQSLYGNSYAGLSPLYRLDTGSGAATAGPALGLDNLADMASSGTDTFVWAVRSSDNTLHRIDVTTGAVVSSVAIASVNPAGAPETIVSIAYDGRNGTMYGSSTLSIGGGNGLYKIDPGTGSATWIGGLQADPMYALAFDGTTNQLFGVSGESQGLLWRIDTGNAALTLVNELVPTSNYDIAFAPDGKLFMASSGSNSLYEVNPLNAAATLIGPYGAAINMAGLAFAVPEPGTYAMFALGLAGMGVLLRRRRAAAPGQESL